MQPSSRFPLAFPPRGVFLILLCALFVLPGLIGHDPWKGDDATHIGVVYGFVTGNDWLMPRLAGELYFDHPPLFHWLGAMNALALESVLPVHDAVRLLSGLFVALTLVFLALTARQLNDVTASRIAPLIALGSLGLFLHSHLAQPMTTFLAANAALLYGLAILPSRTAGGGAISGIALGSGFLAIGTVALLFLLPTVVLLPLVNVHWRGRTAIRGLALTLALGLLLCVLWPGLLAWRDPDLAAAWWRHEAENLVPAADWSGRIAGYVSLLPWFAWPALPLSAWTLWRHRATLGRPAVTLPLLGSAVSLIVLFLFFPPRSVTALPMLPSLVMLALPAAGTLRRGAANAFDWFGMMTFTVFAAFAWLAWSAMVYGVPAQLARNIRRMEPGFVAEFSWPAVGWAVALTIGWLWLIFSSPRSPWRGAVHWGAGVAMLWALVIALWLPLAEYSRSYRGVAQSLAAVLPPQPGCIAGDNLGESQRASFHYFAGIVTVPLDSEQAENCRFALIQGSARHEKPPAGPGWRKIAEERRPGDRVERYRLYSKD